MSARRVTLLTDFGTRDGFVGAVKGVLASLAPDASVDDVAHDVPRGDVRAAARTLARYWMHYPAGTVHVVVVDPGVGTARRGLACRSSERFLVGPDNGVLTPALLTGTNARCVRIDETVDVTEAASIAPTFHGRDVFAPVAAALARGGDLDSIGTPMEDPKLLTQPLPTHSDGAVEGEVVGVDRFGNLATNLRGDWARPGDVVEVAGRRLELERTYGDVDSGAVLAVVDSEGRIEIAVRDGSAQRALGLGEGAVVRLVRR